MAAAFPGFSRRELVGLDIRELPLWEVEVERQRIRRQIEIAEAVRIGMAAPDGYKDVMDRMQDALRELDMGPGDRVLASRDAWADLRARGRG